jgi:hypothetical protein
LLGLADFLIVLREVEYKPDGGGLTKSEFLKIFDPFLSELALNMEREVRQHHACVSKDLIGFWSRVVEQCQR